MSLVEVLIATGIMAMVMLALSTLLLSQQKEVIRLTTKLSLIDVSNDLRSVIMQPKYCGAIFANQTFDASLIPANGAIHPGKLLSNFDLRQIDTVANINRDIAVIGGNISSTGKVTIVGTALTDWVRVSADEYRASVQISVSQNMGPLAPAEVSGLQINTSPASPLSKKVITSCGAPAPSGPPGGGPPSTPPKAWDSVALTDTMPFDPSCEYRVANAGYATHPGSTFAWHYPIYVDETVIHGAGWDVFSGKKGNSNTSPSWPVTQIEKRCN
jgi:hypothetical protein